MAKIVAVLPASRLRACPPSHPTARPIAAPPTSSATAMSATTPQLDSPAGGAQAEEGHEDDDGWVVETGLDLEDAGQPAGEWHAAQHGEDGCGVGRGEDRSDDEGDLPGEPEQDVRCDGHDADRDEHPDGGQARRGCDGASDAAPLGGDATLDEDEDEGGIPEDLGQERVVIGDADCAIAQHEADPQVDEERGQARPDRQAHGRHAEEDHPRADEQPDREGVEGDPRRRRSGQREGRHRGHPEHCPPPVPRRGPP